MEGVFTCGDYLHGVRLIMKIAIMTMWYNEEYLAHYFLRHYSYADEICVFLDSDTNDNTSKICRDYPNVKIEPFTFEDGFDDIFKQRKINDVVKAKKGFDWVFVLDADEFIFLLGGQDPKEFLKQQKGNVMLARMWQVYRHRTDSDLNLQDTPFMQRRHGDSNLTGFNSNWVKPIIVRPEIGVMWSVGCHRILETQLEQSLCDDFFLGAHWANADPELAVQRRLASRVRQSRSNIEHQYQSHNHDVTEEKIRRICKEHENDSRLF